MKNAQFLKNVQELFVPNVDTLEVIQAINFNCNTSAGDKFYSCFLCCCNKTWSIVSFYGPINRVGTKMWTNYYSNQDEAYNHFIDIRATRVLHHYTVSHKSPDLVTKNLKKLFKFCDIAIDSLFVSSAVETVLQHFIERMELNVSDMELLNFSYKKIRE